MMVKRSWLIGVVLALCSIGAFAAAELPRVADGWHNAHEVGATADKSMVQSLAAVSEASRIRAEQPVAYLLNKHISPVMFALGGHFVFKEVHDATLARSRPQAFTA